MHFNIPFYRLRKKLKQNIRKTKDISLAEGFVCAFSSISMFVSEIPFNFAECTPVTVIFALGTGITLIKHNKYKHLLKDLNKNHKFLANKELFEKMNEEQKQIVLSRQSPKVQNIIISKNNIDINTIDSLNTSEVNKIIEDARNNKNHHTHRKIKGKHLTK